MTHGLVGGNLSYYWQPAIRSAGLRFFRAAMKNLSVHSRMNGRDTLNNTFQWHLVT